MRCRAPTLEPGRTLREEDPMPNCPSCQAKVLQDSIYCESCGWKLDAPVPPAGAQPPQPSAAHGTLRAEIPLLSGAARQLRARLDGLRDKVERSRDSHRRGQEARRQEQEQERQGKGRAFLGILAGVALLVLWVWLLVRGVKGAPATEEQRLLETLLNFSL